MERLKKVVWFILGLESNKKEVVNMSKNLLDELESMLESIKRFCRECDLRNRKECPSCHLYKHYVGE